MILGVAPRWVAVALVLLVLAAVCPDQACGQTNTTDAPTLIPTNTTAAAGTPCRPCPSLGQAIRDCGP